MRSYNLLNIKMKKGVNMLIRVLCQNGKYEIINDESLENYIDSGNILLFKRKDGWATVGIDPIRDTSHGYIGPERRRVAR